MWCFPCRVWELLRGSLRGYVCETPGGGSETFDTHLTVPFSTWSWVRFTRGSLEGPDPSGYPKGLPPGIEITRQMAGYPFVGQVGFTAGNFRNHQRGGPTVLTHTRLFQGGFSQWPVELLWLVCKRSIKIKPPTILGTNPKLRKF